MDDTNVQQGAVSEGTPSTKGEQATPVTPQAQPTIEERVAQLVAAEVEKIKPRLHQSVEDRFAYKHNREVADIQRKLQLAEEEAASLRASVSELDPEAAEMARLRARDKVYAQTEVATAKEREAQAQGDAVNQRLYAHLAKEGIDPNDKGIDWGHDTTDYHEGLNRFYGSVARVKSEKVLAAALKKSEQQAKDTEQKIRKDLGLDSVDTSIASGGAGNSDDAFIRQMAEGKLPTTKENMARFRKITS